MNEVEGTISPLLGNTQLVKLLRPSVRPTDHFFFFLGGGGAWGVDNFLGHEIFFSHLPFCLPRFCIILFLCAITIFTSKIGPG